MFSFDALELPPKAVLGLAPELFNMDLMVGARCPAGAISAGRSNNSFGLITYQNEGFAVSIQYSSGAWETRLLLNRVLHAFLALGCDQGQYWDWSTWSR